MLRMAEGGGFFKRLSNLFSGFLNLWISDVAGGVSINGVSAGSAAAILQSNNGVMTSTTVDGTLVIRLVGTGADARKVQDFYRNLALWLTPRRELQRR